MKNTPSPSGISAPQGLTRMQSLKHGLLHELKKFILFTIYFFVWFYAISLYTSMLLEANGMRYAVPTYSLLFVLVKAAIVAKFFITAELVFPMHVSKRFPLVFSLLGHSFVYLAVVMLLSVLEKGVEGLVHHKGFVSSMQTYANADPKLVAAIAFVYWLVIVHCLLYAAVERYIGSRQIRLFLFHSNPQER